MFHFIYTDCHMVRKADSRFVPSQWETALLYGPCMIVPHKWTKICWIATANYHCRVIPTRGDLSMSTKIHSTEKSKGKCKKFHMAIIILTVEQAGKQTGRWTASTAKISLSSMGLNVENKILSCLRVIFTSKSNGYFLPWAPLSWGVLSSMGLKVENKNFIMFKSNIHTKFQGLLNGLISNYPNHGSYLCRRRCVMVSIRDLWKSQSAAIVQWLNQSQCSGIIGWGGGH